ncbi:MAG TPA: regulatory iron-sulfur-containing complex subunit RicT [Moheibacter sp.]|nr:regulatory iron-sulfur-containing complex subunit RicT [Moheibacter sp.]
MGCAGCGTTSNGVKGCGSNGACGPASGCGKLDVFDWLSNMRLPNGQAPFECVEVRFKNDRKLFFKNKNQLPLYIGDIIAVEAQSGHDIGVVTLTGELVRIQMKNKKVHEDAEEVRKVYRKANEKDIETWQACREKEDQVKVEARKIARNLGLEMKISDVEFQGDGTKAIFYYTAEGRIDFRELIKQFAAAFSIRIEMRQIGYRQEAAKIGGIGSCGRELCCSTWLTDFRSVNTTAARYQQLSINPQKLAGNCGKLKCCLNFELDSYLDALTDFPSIESTFETEKGTAACMKIDVFKKEMWFAYVKGGVSWYKFTVNQIKDFMTKGSDGGKTASLEDLAKESSEVKKESVDVIQENSLERFERKNRKKRKRTDHPAGEKPKNQSNKRRSPAPAKKARSGEAQAKPDAVNTARGNKPVANKPKTKPNPKPKPQAPNQATPVAKGNPNQKEKKLRNFNQKKKPNPPKKDENQ